MDEKAEDLIEKLKNNGFFSFNFDYVIGLNGFIIFSTHIEPGFPVLFCFNSNLYGCDAWVYHSYFMENKHFTIIKNESIVGIFLDITFKDKNATL